MKRKGSSLIILICFSLLFLISCGDAAFDNLKVEVENAKGVLEEEFNRGQTIINSVRDEAIAEIKKVDMATLDVSGMDESEGGPFYIHASNDSEVFTMRYNPDERSSLITSLGVESPVTDSVKKKVKLISLFEPIIKSKIDDVKYIDTMMAFGTDNTFCVRPAYDFWANIPMPMDFSVFDWFSQSVNSVDEVSYLDLIINVSVGTFQQVIVRGTGETGADKTKYGLFYQIPIGRLIGEKITDKSEAMIIITRDTIVCNISKPMKDAFGIKAVNQLVTSVTTGSDEEALFDLEKYKLENQNEAAKKIASVLTADNIGKDDFVVNLNGEDRKAYLLKVDNKHVSYYVLGIK